MSPSPLPRLPASATSRIGIVMMSALGDAVHVLPVVTALKRHASDTHIAWILQPGPASLVRGHPDVDEIVEFDQSRGLAAYGDVRRRLSGRLDLVLALQVYFKAGLLTALLDAPVKLGFDRARARDLNWLATTHRIPPHAPQHVQDQYFEFLAALGVPHEPVAWNLGPWPHERDAQRPLLAPLSAPYAVLVIGASHAAKEWRPERWAAVCDALPERYGLTPVLAGGRSPRELATERAIAAACRHAPVSTLGWKLRDLVGLIDGAALVIALDTGPVHMAVALNRPVISLMGWNNPKRVGPYRRFHDLIVDGYGNPGEDYPVSLEHRAGRMATITVGMVLDRVAVWRQRY